MEQERIKIAVFSDLYERAIRAGIIDNPSNVATAELYDSQRFIFWLQAEHNVEDVDDLITWTNLLKYFHHEKKGSQERTTAETREIESDREDWQLIQELDGRKMGQVWSTYVDPLEGNPRVAQIEAWRNIVNYFNATDAEVQLFTCGNAHCLKMLDGDLFSLRFHAELESKAECEQKSPALLDNDARYEAKAKELQALFNSKFIEAKQKGKVSTPQAFAKAEASRLGRAWANVADRFPIAEQWLQYLEDVQTGKEQPPQGDPQQQRIIDIDKAAIWATGCRDIVEYFNAPKGAEVQLFREGNAHFMEQVKQDLAELEAAKRGTGDIPTPWRTVRQLDAHFTPEALQSELGRLLQAKFKDIGIGMGYKTQAKFTAHELERLTDRWQWRHLADGFPIAEQWLHFLRERNERTISGSQTDKPSPNELILRMEEQDIRLEKAKRERAALAAEPVTPTSAQLHWSKSGTQAENEHERRAITFTDNATVEAIHEGLKAFFPERENDLLTLLKGGKVKEPLHFSDQQNRLAEVFSRAYYNGKMGGTKTDVQTWIVQNFTYLNGRTKKATPFKSDTLRGIFTPQGKGEATQSKRIAISGLQYIAPHNRPKTGSE